MANKGRQPRDVVFSPIQDCLLGSPRGLHKPLTLERSWVGYEPPTCAPQNPRRPSWPPQGYLLVTTSNRSGQVDCLAAKSCWPGPSNRLGIARLDGVRTGGGQQRGRSTIQRCLVSRSGRDPNGAQREERHKTTQYNRGETSFHVIFSNREPSPQPLRAAALCSLR